MVAVGLLVVAQSILGVCVVSKAARGGGQGLAKCYRIFLLLTLLLTVRTDRLQIFDTCLGRTARRQSIIIVVRLVLRF